MPSRLVEVMLEWSIMAAVCSGVIAVSMTFNPSSLAAAVNETLSMPTKVVARSLGEKFECLASQLDCNLH